jgi:TonB family protein
MPISEPPTEVNEPKGPAESGSQAGSSSQDKPIPGSILGIDTINESEAHDREARSALRSSSRWVDYETHELLQIISDLEDERRWARLREGMLWAVLFHIVILFALFLIPKYLLKLVPVVQTSSMKDHKDFTYLDSPSLPAPKPVKPLPNRPLIDKQTMEEMKRKAPPAPAPPQQPQEQPPAPEQAKVQPPPPIVPPNPQSQSPVEAPRPQAVPAKPNFAVSPTNPADQLRHDMEGAARNRGSQSYENQAQGGLAMHPGASGGVQILSPTEGVDFSNWLARWHYITEQTWDPLIPDEVNPPILKSGMVVLHFKVLPNGQVIDEGMDGRSGDSGLDRAAWGAISGSSYPPLPREFHGPYLELRAYFLYNMQPQ